MADSGLDERGGWMPAFEGQRRAFEAGNDLAVKHGAWSSLRLEPRAAELTAEIRAVLDVQVPTVTEADEPAIRLLALSLAQVEAATLHVAEQGLVDEHGNPRGILRHLGTMMNTAARLCDRLGMTPSGRAALGLDVARGRGEALRAHLAARAASAGADGADVDEDYHGSGGA